MRLGKMIERELEDEYVVDRLGTTWRAIDVFKTGETQGIRNERQRIIKLLEAERWTLPNGIAAGGEVYLPIEEAIALIKGEQK